MIRLLIYGMPGTPIYEVAEGLADFHDVDLFTIERQPDMESYWSDKIPDFRLDTGDLLSGSESQQMSRDPLSEEKDRALDSESLELEGPLEQEEVCAILKIPSGILVTEISDTSLVSWSTHILFIDADEEMAVDWFKYRRKCRSCNSVFHMKDKPPQVPGICDRCGTDLQRRSEDHPLRVRKQYRNWRSDFNEMNNMAKGNKHYLKFRADLYDNVQKMQDRVEKWLRKSSSTEGHQSRSAPDWNYRSLPVPVV